MVFINALKRDIRRIILDHPDMRRKRDHQRQVEVKVAASTLLTLAQAAVEMSEELQNPLLTSAIPSRWVLNGEGVKTTVMTSNFQSAVTDSYTSDKIDIWQESIDTNKVLILVFMLQILSWDLDLIKLLEPEFAEVAGVVLQVSKGPSAVKLFLKFVSPSPKLVDIFVHRWFLEDEVRVKLFADMGREDGLRKSRDVGLGCRW